MKIIVVVSVVFFVAVLGQLTDEQVTKLEAYKESCIGESGVDPAVVANVKDGQIAEGDEKLACFATCMLKEMGIMSADGNIDMEAALAKIPPGVPQDEIDRIFANCRDITGNGCEKGGNLLKCVLENRKVSIIQ